MGDPAGVGAEITVAAWQKRNSENLHPFFLIDNLPRLEKLFPDVKFHEIQDTYKVSDIFDEALPILNIDLPEEPVLGQLNTKNGTAVIESIKKAVELTQQGFASGAVTNPIHKAALYDIGFDFAGHTEFLGALCGNVTSVMMLATQELRVVPLTVHHAVKAIPDMITEDLIIEKSHIIHDDLKNKFGFKNPRIAIAGLNPHAGEGGAMGMEEIQIIAPAIKKLQTEGMDVTGPYPADTLFHAEARAQYDVALCMYHDQALIPLKTLDFHGGVNVTLGLPIIRTSPDHGTALEIAGKGMANPSSLIAAIKMAQQLKN